MPDNADKEAEVSSTENFHALKNIFVCSFNFCGKKLIDENDVSHEHLFHVSNLSHVMPSQTVPKISNTTERFST